MTYPKPTRTCWKIVLAVLVLFAAVGWFIAWPAFQQHRTIQEIERLDGYINRKTVGSQWLKKLVFDNGRVVEVDLEGTEITDDGLQHLSGLPNLGCLRLSDTRISNDGLKHLGSLTSLRVLILDRTDISDAGLKHLNGLTNLEQLSLVDTHVSDDGVKMLQESLPNCEIDR